jgi:hypothetical protein
VTGMEITLRDVYDAQQAGRTEMAALAAQVSQLTATVNLQLAAGNLRIDDHESRIRAGELAPKVLREEHEAVTRRVRSLETSRAKLTGVWAALSVLAGVAAAWAEHLLSGH